MAKIRFQERRRFPRINLSSQLHYKIRGTPEFGDAVVRDISVGGAGIVCDRYIAPSSLLTLELSLLSRILHPVGRVASSYTLPHSERNRIGLQFIDMDSDEKRYLQDYINLKTSPV